MKPPWYKVFWSYFSEILIESTESEVNEDLYLVLKKGQYQLCTQNAIYSYGNRYDNFSQTFLKLNLDKPDVKSVLVLGMGLGSIPYMLEKLFKRNMEFTCVEIDDEIIGWAHKYVFDDMQSFVQVIEGDAYSFTYLTEEKYDMICLDVFIDAVIPEEFLEIEFMEDLKSLLTENGFIIFNHLALYDIDIQKATTYFNDVFRPCFENSTFLQLKTNMMLLSDQSRLKK